MMEGVQKHGGGGGGGGCGLGDGQWRGGAVQCSTVSMLQQAVSEASQGHGQTLPPAVFPRKQQINKPIKQCQ